MRQHAIPQNILDVEFKIFTKFTLKEFAYLAIGIGVGGIFLYMYAKNQMPSFLAIPIFIVSSGIGIFFALVPINDQPADQYIKNFIKAIQKPTRRVWLDPTMKKNRTEADVQIAKDTASKNMEDAVKRPKIIGSSKINTKKEEFDDNGIDLLSDTTPVTVEKKTDTSKTPAQKTFIEKQLVITSENISKYQFDIQGADELPGNINIWVSDKGFKPVSGVVIQLNDKDGNILYANRTPESGYFLTNRIFPEGIYLLKMNKDGYIFPDVKIVLEKQFAKKPIKITAL